MAHPAVDFVLDTIKTNWSAGNYGDIPLERIDRNRWYNHDRGFRKKDPELTKTNYVGAAYTNRNTSAIGTEYDLSVDGIVVEVRIEGLHHSEHGYIDPTASIPPATSGDPVPFNDDDGLVGAIKDTLNAERTFPDATSRVDETDIVIRDEPGPLSYESYDGYRYQFDVVVSGYEEL